MKATGQGRFLLSAFFLLCPLTLSSLIPCTQAFAVPFYLSPKAEGLLLQSEPRLLPVGATTVGQGAERESKAAVYLQKSLLYIYRRIYVYTLIDIYMHTDINKFPAEVGRGRSG